MDRSKKYIMMCKEAVEIQKLKEVNKEIYTKHISSVNRVDADFKGRFWFNLNNEEWIWIPRQDQLQKIYAEKHNFNDVHKEFKLAMIMSQFLMFIRDEYTLPIKSFEEAWLLFVMRENYQKKWNGSEWEEIN